MNPRGYIEGMDPGEVQSFVASLSHSTIAGQDPGGGILHMDAGGEVLPLGSYQPQSLTKREAPSCIRCVG